MRHFTYHAESPTVEKKKKGWGQDHRFHKYKRQKIENDRASSAIPALQRLGPFEGGLEGTCGVMI